MTKSEKGRGRPPSAAPMARQIGIRIGADDDEQLAAITAKLPGFDQTTVARAALRIGLTVLELEQTAIVQAGAPPPKRRAWLKPHFSDE